MNPINPVEIGERIKKQRLLNGYSRETLSELADITPRFCYDLELGLKNMSVNTLCKLSSSLHISTDYLLFGPVSEEDELKPIYGIIQKCPANKRWHLEQIISCYIQAVNEKCE